LDYGTLPVKQRMSYSGGFHAFHSLLGRIYADVSYFEGEDDNKKYSELLNTMAFLYVIFKFGTLSNVNEVHAISLDKAMLQQQYKKGNLTFRIRHVEHYGLSLKTYNTQGECDSLHKASLLKLSYPQHPDLIPAVKCFVDCAELLEGNANEHMYNSFGMFIKGDVQAALARMSIRRSDLDPYRDDILRTVGTYKYEWVKLVENYTPNANWNALAFCTIMPYLPGA
jgi:hypothetical protein